MMVMILIILSVMMAVATAMLDSVDGNVQIINYSKRATYARLAALSACNYASGRLVEDAAGSGGGVANIDSLNEPWHMATHTTAGLDAPVTAFLSSYGNGYFVNDVYDLSGRIPSNSTSTSSYLLITRYPADANVKSRASNFTGNAEKTPWECNEYTDVTTANGAIFNPYDVAGYKINLNTIGQLANYAGGTQDDISAAILTAGGATQTGVKRVTSYRRHATGSGTALDFPVSLGIEPAICDYNVQRVFSTNLQTALSWGSSTAAYHGAYTFYGTCSSAGYFLIHSKAFLSATASGTKQSAANRLLTVVKRTSTGFTTLYVRWFWNDSTTQFTY